MKETVNIAYSCNEAYIPQTGISIISLLETNKDVEDLHIYFIATNVSKKSVELLQNICAAYKRKFIMIPFEAICANLRIKNTGRHIETVYAKLFFGNIREVDTILYLDSDIIVNGPILPLYHTHLHNAYFACVKTTTKDYCAPLGLSEKEDFFNDGMALVNAKALREQNMEKRFTDFIAQYDGDPPVLSEGVINTICKGRIAVLAPKYNQLSAFLMFTNHQLRLIAHQTESFYTDEELNEARTNPVLIHYLTGWFKRPWEKGCTRPFKGHYLKYKMMSPWAELPLKERKLPKKIILLKYCYKILPTELVLWLRKLLAKK